MDLKVLNDCLKDVFKKYKISKIKQNTFLGIFSIKTFNKLDLTNIRNSCLILFIDYLNNKLGHFVCIFKIHNDLIFVDSFGMSNSFYKNNILNKYTPFKQYLSKRLQSSVTTACGAYVVFFINTILKCNYDLNKFAVIVIQYFPKQNNYIQNDKIIFRYIVQNTRISYKNCQKYFCNNKFAIKYKKCLKSIC